MKKIYALLLIIISFVVFNFFWILTRYTTPILVYHNINSRKGSFFVSPENFSKQMEYIKKNGYQVISLDELVRSIQTKTPLKRNKVVITFDDGYQDNFEYAYPVLKKMGFPATIFLVTDYIGKTSGFLNWDEVVAMSKDKISFGGHTKTHFYLGSMGSEDLAFGEIKGSKEAIEQKINMPVDYFCYPGGGFNQRTKELVALAGYRGACTTNRGFVKFNRDVYELKRVKVTNSDAVKPLSFWVKLSGYYNVFRQQKGGD